MASPPGVSSYHAMNRSFITATPFCLRSLGSSHQTYTGVDIEHLHVAPQTEHRFFW